MLLSSYGSGGARPRIDAGQEHGWHHHKSKCVPEVFDQRSQWREGNLNRASRIEQVLGDLRELLMGR